MKRLFSDGLYFLDVWNRSDVRVCFGDPEDRDTDPWFIPGAVFEKMCDAYLCHIYPGNTE